jgi:copper chaperone CopZ
MELSELRIEDSGGGRTEVVFKISGITCNKCVRLITECLTDMDGVQQVLVSKGKIRFFLSM